ncbi:hypothetical protein OG21DRAFT_535983 [Imleria badia]|nr:hypothetical protein OG21DRAFT_535983 [Imleria badia]
MRSRTSVEVLHLHCLHSTRTTPTRAIVLTHSAPHGFATTLSAYKVSRMVTKVSKASNLAQISSRVFSVLSVTCLEQCASHRRGCPAFHTCVNVSTIQGFPNIIHGYNQSPTPLLPRLSLSPSLSSSPSAREQSRTRTYPSFHPGIHRYPPGSPFRLIPLIVRLKDKSTNYKSSQH